MKTMFQISITVGSSALTSADASRPPMRSKWISLQGPQGPVSPISQKLAFLSKGRMRSLGRKRSQILRASSSAFSPDAASPAK